MADNRDTGGAGTPPGLNPLARQYEVTAQVIATEFSFDGDDDDALPAEMLPTLDRIWNDLEFVWPTTITVTRIDLVGESAVGRVAEQQVEADAALDDRPDASGTSPADGADVLPEHVEADAALVRSRVSVLGTGWAPEQPVVLSWQNAHGFPSHTVPLPDLIPDDRGFFRATIEISTTPRRRAEFSWGEDSQLVLLAAQDTSHDRLEARDPALPPHILWRWTR